MGYNITRFDPSTERAGLLSLWHGNLHTAATGRSHLLEQRFGWLYEQNPERPATTWVARADQGDVVVGCASLYPRQLWYGGQEHLVGTGCDFAVAKEHRVFGPALALQRALVENSLDDGYELLLVRPDKASFGLFRRVGYRKIAASERWVKVLRPERYAEDINNSPLIVALSRLAARGLHLLDFGLRAPLLREVMRTRTEILDDVDPRFDALWTEARANYPLAEVRSSAYLGWRFGRLPGQSHRFFCLVDKQTDRLLGYVAFTVENNSACISDLFAVDRDRMMDTLLVQFIGAMHRERLSAISVVFLPNQLLRSKLKRLFFLKREDFRPILLFQHPDSSEHLQRGLPSAAAHDWVLFDGGMDI